MSAVRDRIGSARESKGRRRASASIGALAALALLAGGLPLSGAAAEPSEAANPPVAAGASTTATAKRVGNVAFDVMVLRPVEGGAAAVGAALFLPVAFISAPGGRHALETAWEQFVLTPWSQFYERPLGDF